MRRVWKGSIDLSQVFAGRTVGIKQTDDRIWLVSFMHYRLGYIDLEQRTLQSIDNPFDTGCRPCVTHVSGPDTR